MGVEPTGAGFADAHTVLKTGEATGPLPPPSRASIPGFTASSCASPARARIMVAAGPPPDHAR